MIQTPGTHHVIENLGKRNNMAFGIVRRKQGTGANSLHLVELISEPGEALRLCAESSRRKAWCSKVLGEKGSQEAAENGLGTRSLGKPAPEEEEQLHGIVEWDPVCDAEQGLEQREEGKDHPVCDPLGAVNSPEGGHGE